MRRYLKGIVLGLLGLGLTVTLSAQRSGFEFGAGLQSARMDDMKYLQNLYLENFPVPAENIASFPPYIKVSIGYRRQLYPSLQMGVIYSYNSTGARTNYTDYSGSMNTDFSLWSNRLSAMASYTILGEKRAVLSAYGKAGLNYSRCNINTTARIYPMYSEYLLYEYRSFSPTLAAGLEFFFHFETFSLGLDGAYMADIPGKLQYTDNGDPLLDPNETGRNLTSDWTGWQIQIKAILWL